MPTIILRFTSDLDSYGQDATEADMHAMNELMSEFLESLGYNVEIGPSTGSSVTEHSWDKAGCGNDADDELNQLCNQAWDYACNNYVSE